MKSTHPLITYIKSDSFLKHNVIFFIGSFSVAVLNYLFHPILSRLLDVASFGEVQVLLAIITQASALMNVFGNIVLNIISNSDTESSERTDKDIRTVQSIHTLSLSVALGFSVLFLLAIPSIGETLKFETTTSLYFIPLILLATIPLVFRQKFLQAENDFSRTSISSIVNAGGKVVFASLLVVMGFLAGGAMLGILIAQLVTIYYLYEKTKGRFSLPLFVPITWNTRLAKEFMYGGLIFVSMSYIVFLYTADVIFVKYYFSPEQAGEYSGMATVARTIIFGSASIAIVLLSYAKTTNPFKKNLTILMKGLVFTAGIAGFAALIFSLFPKLILSLLVGSQYVKAAHLLPTLSVTLVFVALANVLFLFFLALREYIILAVAGIGFMAIFVLCSLNHESPMDIVVNFLWGSIMTLALLTLTCIYFVIRHRNELTRENGTVRNEIT